MLSLVCGSWEGCWALTLGSESLVRSCEFIHQTPVSWSSLSRKAAQPAIILWAMERYWHCLTSLLATGTVGLSVPSASFPMTPSCVVQLTCWREEMPSRGSWTGMRDGPMWTSWNSTCPARGSGQSQARIQAGRGTDQDQPWGEGLGGLELDGL